MIGKEFSICCAVFNLLDGVFRQTRVKVFHFVICTLLFSSLTHSFKIESKDFTDKFKVMNILFFVLLKELCGFISYISVFDPFLCCSFLVDLFFMMCGRVSASLFFLVLTLTLFKCLLCFTSDISGSQCL